MSSIKLIYKNKLMFCVIFEECLASQVNQYIRMR